MDMFWDKIGAIFAAIISALGGFYMYDRKSTNDRLTSLEKDMSQTKTDLAVVETKFTELKEDTQEIKQAQKDILALLRRRKS